MIPGDLIEVNVWRQTAAGAASTGKVLADFIIDQQLDGDAVSMTWVVTEGVTDGTWRAYKFASTLPSTAGYLQLFFQPATGTDFLSPSKFGGEIESYDMDSMAALFLSSQGIPAVTSAADNTLGDIVDGDTYKSATLTFPSGKLSPHGITDISAVGITLQASVKATPGGTAYPIVATVVSGPGLTFNISWAGGATQPFPALTTEANKAQFIDVQVLKSGTPNVIVTGYRLSFNQVWQREDRVV